MIRLTIIAAVLSVVAACRPVELCHDVECEEPCLYSEIGHERCNGDRPEWCIVVPTDAGSLLRWEPDPLRLCKPAQQELAQ